MATESSPLRPRGSGELAGADLEQSDFLTLLSQLPSLSDGPDSKVASPDSSRNISSSAKPQFPGEDLSWLHDPTSAPPVRVQTLVACLCGRGLWRGPIPALALLQPFNCQRSGSFARKCQSCVTSVPVAVAACRCIRQDTCREHKLYIIASTVSIPRAQR